MANTLDQAMRAKMDKHINSIRFYMNKGMAKESAIEWVRVGSTLGQQCWDEIIAAIDVGDVKSEAKPRMTRGFVVEVLEVEMNAELEALVAAYEEPRISTKTRAMLADAISIVQFRDGVWKFHSAYRTQQEMVGSHDWYVERGTGTVKRQFRTTKAANIDVDAQTYEKVRW